MGRQKAYKETIWDDLSGRTVYQWPVKQGKTKALKTSVWTDTVCNYIRQKAGEIEEFKALKVDALKWCKEHVPRDGNDWTEEGQMLLDDPELWLDHLTFSDDGNVTHPEREIVPRKTALSCYTKRVP